MKNVNLKGKLTLNKEVVSKLNEGQMLNVKGGGVTYTLICTTIAITRIGCTSRDRATIQSVCVMC